jgi:hypothetical protein
MRGSRIAGSGEVIEHRQKWQCFSCPEASPHPASVADIAINGDGCRRPIILCFAHIECSLLAPLNSAFGRFLLRV